MSIHEEPVTGGLGPVGLLAARLRAAEPGQRSILDSLVRFVLTGVVSVGADIGVLALLHSGLGVDLLLSTIASYAVSLAINYSLNRAWTFQADGSHKQTLTRYAALVAFNLTSQLVIVLGLSALGLFYVLAKLVAIALNAGVNFWASRHWVYATHR